MNNNNSIQKSKTKSKIPKKAVLMIMKIPRMMKKRMKAATIVKVYRKIAVRVVRKTKNLRFKKTTIAPIVVRTSLTTVAKRKRHIKRDNLQLERAIPLFSCKII